MSSKCTPVVPVILCGGAGTRLWPLSRKHFPKPFLKVGGKSLLAQTLERAAAVLQEVVGPQGGDLLLVSNESYQFLIKDECLPLVAAFGCGMSMHQLLEPEGRNTAPAIALAALWAKQQYANTNPILLVLPADHLINPTEAFVQVASQAIQTANEGMLTCFGISPTAPETGFGYIEKGDKLNAAACRVSRFVEKPNQATALEYLASGKYVWNGGMFALGADELLSGLDHCTPEVSSGARAAWSSARCQQGDDGAGGSWLFDATTFSAQPDISIDYALMEKAENVAVVDAGFQWSDIGSFNALAEQSETDSAGNSCSGEKGGLWINEGTENSHVVLNNRTVATIGVRDLFVIDTADALLIADKSRAQDVKTVVSRLKALGSDLVNFNPTVHRPWGTYTVLENAAGYKIKRIEVKCGASLSLQMHHHRSEHWIVVSGSAEVTNGEHTFLVHKNESTYIPAGNKHRLRNPDVIPLIMIEVQSGDYLEEDDIVRFDDVYGRL